MGLFDTVKTKCFWVAFLHWLAGERLGPLRRDLVVSLPFTDQLLNLIAGRRALSVGERRRVYAPKPWRPDRDRFEEEWFAGVHSHTVLQRWLELSEYRPEIPDSAPSGNGDDPTSEE